MIGFVFAIVLLGGTAAITASAQRVGGVRFDHRPVVYYNYYRDPFWSFSAWNDPFYYDPYLRERQERYYRQRNVRDKREDLSEKREKYSRDGYLSDKEREKLAKAERKYNNAVEDLREYYNSD